VPTLRVATFNLLFAHRGDGPGSWSDRLPLIGEAIERASPDVIGFQEAFPSTLDSLRAAAGDRVLIPGPTSGVPRWFDLSVTGELVLRAIRTGRWGTGDLSIHRSERMAGGEHQPIAYRADRLRPVASGAFWISSTPEVAGSMLPVAPVPFMVHWVRFERRDGSGPALVLNAHFGHAPWHHAPTARVVAARLSALGAEDPAFLIGDFNAWPSSPLVRRLTAATGPGFVDAVRAAREHAGPRVTFHWGRGAIRMGLRLDHVLARGAGTPLRAEVIDTHRAGLYPSDHFPLVVEFKS
jgi:endonuclease/exonuclease/phosphatase family metal-dependent hydrolase